jgi:exopolysaccharide biosynthesis polyprenyl glycosylphosphotransferase
MLMRTPVAAETSARVCGARAFDEVAEGSLLLRRAIARHAKAIGAVIGTSIVACSIPRAPAHALALTLVVLLLAGAGSSSRSGNGRLLPFTHAVISALYQAGAALGVWLTMDLTMAGRANLPALVMAGVAAGVATSLARRTSASPPARIAVVGDGRSAEQLRRDLRTAGVQDHMIAGIVTAGPPPAEPSSGALPVLGAIATLAEILDRHAVDTLLISGEAAGAEIMDDVADACLGSAVRVCDVSHFYEDVLGHVPVTEIGSAWFRYVMHPRFRSPDTAAKRALDVAVSLAAGAVFLPVVGLCAMLIKLEDGGPVLFRQRRIGNRGQEFTLLKLRTMRTAAPVARWSSRDDDRVTRVGHVLRRTHLDEIPQLLNVVRGEMSVVGPRPEQPAFVEHLETTLPFYSRRHLIKPGLTGWAQVRCGYAGSDAESAWKLCHDLFYLKHQSISLDLAILVETVRTLVADHQFRGDALVHPSASSAGFPGARSAPDGRWRPPPCHQHDGGTPSTVSHGRASGKTTQNFRPDALTPGHAAQPAASALVERALEVGGIDSGAGADRGTHRVDELLARVELLGAGERPQRRRPVPGRGVQRTELELGKPVARLAVERSGERVHGGGAIADAQCEDAAGQQWTRVEGVESRCLVEA